MLGDTGPFAAMHSHLGYDVLDVDTQRRNYPPQAVVINSEDDNETLQRLNEISTAGSNAPIIVIAGANQALMEFSAAGAAMVLPRETTPKHLAASVFGMVSHKVKDASLFDVWCLQNADRVFMFASKSRTFYVFRADYGPSGAAKTLTDKEMSIIELLISSPGKFATRQQLLNQVWGYNSTVTTHTLETHMYRLRVKLGDRDKAKTSHFSDTTQPNGASEFLATISGGYALRGKTSLHKSPDRRLNIALAIDIRDQLKGTPAQPDAIPFRTVRVASPAEASAAIALIQARQGFFPA
jgi:DNA-binding response OmpR family regulator